MIKINTTGHKMVQKAFYLNSEGLRHDSSLQNIQIELVTNQLNN